MLIRARFHSFSSLRLAISLLHHISVVSGDAAVVVSLQAQQGSIIALDFVCVRVGVESVDVGPLQFFIKYCVDGLRLDC